MIQILLVEDDASLGATLQERLEKVPYSVTWAKSIAEARSYFQSQDLDLILLDVGLPDGSGFEFAEEVKAVKAIPFLFITAQTSAEDRLKGYELGAEEYIPKPFHLKELLMRVKHVIDNHTSQEVLVVNDVTIDFASMTISYEDGSEERLPAKEFQILTYLVEKSPSVVSRDEILNKFWGEGNHPTNRTIDNMILRIRQALGKDGGKLIQSVRGVGYQWVLKGPENK